MHGDSCAEWEVNTFGLFIKCPMKGSAGFMTFM